MSSKSKSQQNTKTAVKSGTDARFDPYLANIAGQANTALGQVDRSGLSGRAIAGRNQFDDMGIAQMQKILGGPNQLDPGTFTKLATDAASGRLLDPATNPTLQGNVDAVTRPLMTDLTTKILPGLDMGAISQNAFGGDRAGIQAGTAIGQTQTAIGDIRAKMYADNYNRERQYQWESPEKFTSALGAELTPAQMQMQLGGYERGMQDLDIKNEIAAKEYNNNQLFAGLPQASSIINPIAGMYGTQNSTGESTSTQTQKNNPLTEIAKIGLGAASVASGMGWNPFGGGGSAGAAPPIPQLPMVGTSQLPSLNPQQLLAHLQQPQYQYRY